MTPEEIQRTIEQMLAVQRELQETQLRQQNQIENQIMPTISQLLESQRELQNSQIQQRDEIDRMIRLVDRLIGYSITNESDHLSLEERMTALERRVRRLEPEN